MKINKNITQILCFFLSLICCISFAGCLEPTSEALNDLIAQEPGTRGNFTEDMLTKQPSASMKVSKFPNMVELTIDVSGHKEILYTNASFVVNYSFTVINTDHTEESISGSLSVFLDFKGTNKYTYLLETTKEIQEVFLEKVTYSSFTGYVHRAN